MKMPAGACDTHFHLFGPLEVYPQDPASKYHSPPALPETYLALLKTLGLSRGVLVNGGAYQDDTKHLEDTLAHYPDRLRGVIRAPETMSEDYIAKLDRLGVRAIRIHRGHGHFQTATAAAVHEHGWHVQFYPRDNLAEFADELLAMPGPVVLDHFAGIPTAHGLDHPSFRVLLQMLDTGRVWVKLSGPMRISSEPFPHRDVTPMARALIRHAPERMVWGSDWPHTNIKVMPDDGKLLDMLLEWAPEESDRQRILSDNAAALYAF
jgi:predicted TIM-barrel fold metal-dependent hydrolase